MTAKRTCRTCGEGLKRGYYHPHRTADHTPSVVRAYEAGYRAGHVAGYAAASTEKEQAA